MPLTSYIIKNFIEKIKGGLIGKTRLANLLSAIILG
jgi:hypothetical protein